ncbi:HNH endonuclease [Paraclostridium bifermentans]
MDNEHLGVLRKINSLKGEVLYGLESIKGRNGKKLPPDKFVDKEHILHDLIRGFYKPKGKKYILSYLATESNENYGRQIYWQDNGEFEYIKMLPPNGEKDNRKKSDIEAARNNLKYEFPIGILHKVDKGIYRVLGLGIITEETKDGVFIVMPYGTYLEGSEKNNNEIVKEDINTEIEVSTTQRVGQSQLRNRLIEKYKKCQICGLDIVDLLIASHIKPWKYSNNEERLDINNGLLLCPNHDKLFDKGFITFNNDGSIVISDLLNSKNKDIMRINNNIKIELNLENKKYMNWHRKYCLKK